MRIAADKQDITSDVGLTSPSVQAKDRLLSERGARLARFQLHAHGVMVIRITRKRHRESANQARVLIGDRFFAQVFLHPSSEAGHPPVGAM